MTAPSSPFSLTISLNVLEHLGISLYSNVPSVLSEIVANAWDADARIVRIDWDRADHKIVIFDDGVGMTADDVNRRFLTVGYRRRDSQPGKTPLGRSPMGRKGIGKLSLFSIAGVVEIETAKGGQTSAFRMRLDDIRREIERAGTGTGTYRPETLPADGIDFDHGTRITLTDLRKRQTIRSTKALKRRLARRFLVIGSKEGFSVSVDGQEVTPADRDYYDKIQYLWTYGDAAGVADLCVNAAEKSQRPQLEAESPIKVDGWLGTVEQVKHLKDEDGDNLNRVALFVRGKMAQEDVLGDFTERGVFVNYLIGELRIDDLDSYDGPGTDRDDDAATSSRQQIVEDDPRYGRLKEFVARELRHIQNEWAKLRAEAGAEKALQIPAVNDWMKSLKPAVRSKARRWLGKLNRIRIDDLDEQKQLMKHAILAFEFYRINENLDQLEKIDDDTLPAALSIFEELDGLESNLYGQIVQQRVQVIRALEEKVDDDAREKAIQKYLFDHLWLLDPSWERTEGTEVMERPVTALFEKIDAGLTEEEKAGRIDIAYRKTAGQHVIIEMKRPGRIVTTPELIAQIDKYLTGMQKILDVQGAPHEPVEFVVLLGREPSDWSTTAGKTRSIDSLRNYSTRVVFYEKLLRDARQAYQDYLSKRSEVDKLEKIIREIDDYAPPASP